MKAKNIFNSIPENFDDEIIEQLVQNKKVNIESIVSKGHVSPSVGWYDQEKDEWVIVLKGSAIVAFEGGEEIKLEAGDYINILAHSKHKVNWTDPDIATVWLAVHY